MSPKEWRRLRKMVEDAANPIPWAGGLMWACTGIAPSAFLAWIAWIAAYSQLPAAAQLQFAWVGSLMLVTGVAAVILGLLAFVIDLSIRRAEKRSINHVLEYMDDVHPQ